MDNSLLDNIKNLGLTSEELIQVQKHISKIVALMSGVVSRGKIEIMVPDPTVDDTIYIDRSLKLVDLHGVHLVYSELENVGPTQYRISDVGLWLHPNQKLGEVVSGLEVYKYLREQDMLKSCFGRIDLSAIFSRDLGFFRQYFAGKVLCAWKSVGEDWWGDVWVPALFEDHNGKLVMDQISSGDDWEYNHVAPIFTSDSI